MIRNALVLVAASVAMALCGLCPANAQQRTAAQIKADVDLEALAWFQPDMTQEDLAAVEMNYNCVLSPRKFKNCPAPPHPIPPDVLKQVAVILHDAKSVYANKGQEAFVVWITLENRRAEAAYSKAYRGVIPVSK